MKITILGAGNIGRTIGNKWAQAGHEIQFGVRDKNHSKITTLLSSIGTNASAAAIPQAIEFGEIVLVAIPYDAAAEIIQANRAALAGKIIIDATNKFGASVVNNIETIAKHVPTAIIFRAFNSLGWEIFEQPEYGDIIADHFYCGPDDNNREIVEQLISEIGVQPIYVGGLETAPTVDALGTLWVTLVFNRGMDRKIAFKLLH